MTKVYVGDVGTVLLLDTGQSLAGATTLAIEARRPSDGAAVTWTATADGTKVRVVSAVGTFSEAGRWLLQAYVVLPSGTWRGETVQLQVHKAFG